MDIKRNMSTSAWSDVYNLLASKRASVVDGENQLIPSDRLLEDIKEAGNMAAMRFAVVAGEDAKMQLQLQCLPGSANTLMGKPLLRGKKFYTYSRNNFLSTTKFGIKASSLVSLRKIIFFIQQRCFSYGFVHFVGILLYRVLA